MYEIVIIATFAVIRSGVGLWLTFWRYIEEEEDSVTIGGYDDKTNNKLWKTDEAECYNHWRQ